MFIMSDWEKDEKALDELMNKMPKFTDHRSKEDVYNRVKMELENQNSEKNKRTTRMFLSKWKPFVVSIASILILTFLVTNFVNEKESSLSKDISSRSMEQKSSKKEGLRSMDPTEEASISSDTAETESTNSMLTMSSLDISSIELVPLNNTTSVYEDNLHGGTIFHFSLIENALSVPVTIIIPKEQMISDFPNMPPNSLQLYERYANIIDEEALGFNDYHPYKGYFSAEGKQLKHYLPAEHGYDIAPGTSAPYWSSINEIFTDFDSLMRLKEDGTPIEWDQAGILDKPSVLSGAQAHQSYFKYVAFNGKSYLSPNFTKSFDSLSEAFVYMKNSENDIYTSVIPNKVTYSFRVDHDITIIRFDEPIDLSVMDGSDANLMIEAFSLTAASFGSAVKLENVVQKQWNEFDLTKPLPVPLGPNGFIMEAK